MTANNNWPDKPGVPLNPEKDGWHWLQEGDLVHECAFWRAQPHFGDKQGRWEKEGAKYDFALSYEISAWHYLGPVLTPDEAAKREDAKWHEGYAAGVLDVRRGTAFGEPDTHYAALQARADQAALGHAREADRADRSKFLHKQKIAALQKRAAELEGALREMVYEATHLSPEEDDGSHWCKISKGALVKARAALTGGKNE